MAFGATQKARGAAVIAVAAATHGGRASNAEAPCWGPRTRPPHWRSPPCRGGANIRRTPSTYASPNTNSGNTHSALPHAERKGGFRRPHTSTRVPRAGAATGGDAEDASVPPSRSRHKYASTTSVLSSTVTHSAHESVGWCRLGWLGPAHAAGRRCTHRICSCVRLARQHRRGAHGGPASRPRRRCRRTAPRAHSAPSRTASARVALRTAVTCG